MQGDAIKVWFPIKKGFLGPTVEQCGKAVDGVERTWCVRARRWASSGESGSGKTTPRPRRLSRIISSEGSIRLDEPPVLTKYCLQPDAPPGGGEMQIVFQDPFGSLSPRMSGWRDHRGRGSTP